MHQRRQSFRLALALLILPASIGHTIGVIHRWSSDGIQQLGFQWEQVACATILGIRHAEARDGSIISELAGIPAGHNFTAVEYDSGSTSRIGIVAYRQALAAGAQILVGPGRSAVNIPLALNGAVDRMPHISWWASTPSLSDKARCEQHGCMN